MSGHVVRSQGKVARALGWTVLVETRPLLVFALLRDALPLR
jgi:hypothetical protein